MQAEKTTTKCEVITRLAQPTMVVRGRTSIEALQQLFGANLMKVMMHLGEQRSYPAGPAFGMYHNMDMRDLDVEIGFPVLAKMEGKDEVQPSELPAGRYASYVHVGPYSTISKGYETLMQWIKEQGYETTEVAIEMYLNDPQQVPPEKLETQILFPLKK